MSARRRKAPSLSRWLRRLAWVAMGCLFTLVAVYVWVSVSTRGYLFQQAAGVPPAPVALVLGTARYVPGGGQNRYFTGRMQAAAQLYHAGKVRRLILSGDNRLNSYNEPRDMMQALRELGVPDSVLVPDFAGFRTFDSVVRTRTVFQVPRVIIVSQAFHLERALFIARHKGIDAVGLCAPSQVTTGTHLRNYLRESLARINTVLDVFILGTEPRFNGPPEPLFPAEARP